MSASFLKEESFISLNGSNQLSSAKEKNCGLPTESKNVTNVVAWLVKKQKYDKSPIGLHHEIVDFYNFMSTRPCENHARNIIINAIKKTVFSLWPSAKVEVFGSVSTGLYLPTSDLDFVIFGKWEALPLRTLEEVIKRENLCDDEGVKVIEKASVPIVKFTDRNTGIKVDLSFNIASGIQSAELIQSYIKTYPKLPYLMLVLKQFLNQRELNEVFTGGISSYCLLLLVVSFFQLHPRKSVNDSRANLGVLLIEFFELYGCLFNYDNTAISVRNSGTYVPKEKMLNKMDLNSRSFLCIEDPVQPSNNVARGSFNASQVKQAFEFAFHVLSKAVSSHISKEKSVHSFLSRIIQVDDSIIADRKKVAALYDNSSSVLPKTASKFVLDAS